MREFPQMKGFSVTNLKYIKRFYLFYNQDSAIRQQVADELENKIFSIPWFHHVEILTKCDDVDKAIFYINKTIENGWSRSLLMNFLGADLYERQGKSVNNFARLLPSVQSDLAKEVVKDPYNFDFLMMTEGYRERELEDALTGNITKFLLELGSGFAYVGRQVQITVGGETFFIDLLFYHLELRCYVVIELKACKFEASFTGQLGLYVSAVNHQLKKDTDNPTIGLLICKTKDDIVAQYSLESSSHPIGISEYELSKLIPEDFKSSLPSIEDIESSLKNIE